MEKEEKQSYQFRALSRKTLSYQKRQIFTNVCCVGCCPFLMVLICGILTIVVQALVNNLNEVQYFRYCSDANASDPFTLLPSPLSESFLDEDGKEQTRLIVNFHPKGDCVQYFGGLFPSQYPYAPPQADNCSAFFNPELCPLDSTSPVPAPQNGWLPDPTSIPITAGMAFANLILKQANFWGMVASKNGLDIGERPAKPSLSLTPPFVPSPSTPPSGFLANYKTEYFTPNNVEDYQAAKVVFEPRPYFKKVNTSEDYHEVDDSLLGIFDDLLSQLSDIPILPKEPTDQERINYTLSAQAILRQVPMGALIIEELGPEKFEYILQMGTNRRLAFQASGDDVTGKSLPNSTYHFPPLLTEGYRRIYQHAKFVQAILSSIPAFANYTLTQGLRIFPEEMSTAFDLPIGSFTGEILYPFGVSFLLPVFVVSMVKEKEDRILIMMRMNGMKTRVYWLSEYIHFYVLHIIATAVFIITGVVLKLEFFTLTDPGAYVLMFFLWGHTQIAMAFFLSTLFNKSRVALILVFCLVLAGVVINVSFSFLFSPNSTPMAYLIYPPFAFYRAISIMNQKSFTPAFPAYSMEMMVPGDPVFDCAMAMIIETVLLFLISAYLMAVLPSEYGIHRPWHFVFSDPYKWWKKRQQKEKEKKPIKEEKITLNDSNEEDHFKEDEDVQAERLRLYNNEYDPDCPVIIKDMRKIYPNGKLAVKSISLAIEKNSVFGLLGPNGAGKTTLISILTGLYPPSSGQALLAGFDVNTEMEDIYLNIGVCPQHDILWDDLTVEEHLYFYARIKGVSPKNEAKAVDTAMETVSLKKYQNTLSKRLSGGEKRRLSIAISLIGDGKVIFLDEPTTGLDPEVRRLIWDIVNKAKVGRTIILTTHSMEEAEVLCQRIGIMAKGTLRCLGPQVRLKNKYGSGFKISISCNPEDHERVSNYIESLLPNGWKKLDDFVGSISYEFDAQEISSLFREIEERKEEVGIKFWGISQTSLEEVFIHIINEADAEAS